MCRRLRNDWGDVLPFLTRDDLAIIVAVLDAPTDSFAELSRIAGLDPTRDFRGANLRGIDFGTDDLAGFDFSGADLTGALVARVSGRESIISDPTTRW